MAARFERRFLAALIPMLITSFSLPLPAPATEGSTLAHALPLPAATAIPKFQGVDSGNLAVQSTSTKKQLGKCPLKHTSVSAKVSGYVSRVTVKQLFENPFKEKIEAIYTFPLSETAAVDDMLMKVGNRTIHGTIKKKQEAREIYEHARDHGQTASLLDQERENIFTQSVANIKPGEQIEITLQYVDLLPFEDGNFTFAFPTVVGPRFNPGQPVGKTGTGWSPDTNSVPDASKITPPVAAAGTRAGHDLSVSVSLDAGVPVQDISSRLHEVDIKRSGAEGATITLKDKATIPNKDFVLSWQVASDKLQSGYLTHGKDGAGYFTMMMVPPRRVTPENVAPKEMIFLIDCSGSQSGAPLEKAKETMDYIVDNMNANDTFQIISFSDHLKLFGDKPLKASQDMRDRAHKFIRSLQANGGTWMAPAVEKACSVPADANRLRIITFMTDGFVGNDYEIIGLVKKLRGSSRWFPFGTGNSVNRLLIDQMAKQGGGEAEYILLNSPGKEIAKKFYQRISSPVLTNVKVDFEGLSVKEVYPHEISDVWAQRPLYIKGRYTKPGKGTVTLSGFAGGKPYSQKLAVTFPEKNAENAVLGSVWARAKVDRLMSEDWLGAQSGSVNNELKEEIIKVALDHHIMTNYTSFVAVEEITTTSGGKPKTVVVPVELPDGVSREGVFGKEEEKAMAPGSLRTRTARNGIYPSSMPAPIMSGGGGGGIGGGGGGGYGYLAKGSYSAGNAGIKKNLMAQSKGDVGRAFYQAPSNGPMSIVDESPRVESQQASISLPKPKEQDRKDKSQLITINIEVSTVNAKLLKELERIGLKVLRTHEKTLECTIEESRLGQLMKQIKKIKEVIRIERADKLPLPKQAA